METCEIASTALICLSSFLKQLISEWAKSLFVSVSHTSVSGNCWKMSLIPVSEPQYILFLQFPLNNLFRRGGSRSQVIKLPDNKAVLDALVVHSVEFSVAEEGVTAWSSSPACGHVRTVADRAHSKVEFCIWQPELCLAGLLLSTPFECIAPEIQIFASAKHWSCDFAFLPGGRNQSRTWWCVPACLWGNFLKDLISVLVWFFIFFLMKYFSRKAIIIAGQKLCRELLTHRVTGLCPNSVLQGWLLCGSSSAYLKVTAARSWQQVRLQGAGMADPAPAPPSRQTPLRQC